MQRTLTLRGLFHQCLDSCLHKKSLFHINQYPKIEATNCRMKPPNTGLLISSKAFFIELLCWEYESEKVQSQNCTLHPQVYILLHERGVIESYVLSRAFWTCIAASFPVSIKVRPNEFQQGLSFEKEVYIKKKHLHKIRKQDKEQTDNGD